MKLSRATKITAEKTYQNQLTEWWMDFSVVVICYYKRKSAPINVHGIYLYHKPYIYNIDIWNVCCCVEKHFLMMELVIKCSHAYWNAIRLGCCWLYWLKSFKMNWIDLKLKWDVIQKTANIIVRFHFDEIGFEINGWWQSVNRENKSISVCCRSRQLFYYS